MKGSMGGPAVPLWHALRKCSQSTLLNLNVLADIAARHYAFRHTNHFESRMLIRTGSMDLVLSTESLQEEH